MLFRAFLALSACTGALAQTAGVTTRYWDCCKPSCAWPGKAALSSTLKTCSASGSVLSDQNAVSGCDGGTSFMCTSDAPVVVSDTLAYGTAATALSGLGESDTCCSCYKLTFTSAPLVGKTLIVQSINTGGDLGGNQFDLAIPGGGMGIFTSGCPSQFGVSANNFGSQYGGVSSDAECDNLPSALQEGCRFRFGWMQGADNPSVTFAKVACPAALVARTGCLRSGETTDGSAALTSSKVTTTSSKTAVTTSRKTTTTTKASTSSAKATTSKKPVTTTKATTSTAKPATSKKPTTNSTRMTTSVKSSAAACSPHTTTTSASKGVAQLYYQCGGIGWTGATTCATGSTCKKQNPYYSQCL